MESLKELRKKIDQIDRGILKWLKRRFEITEKVGKLKFKENLPPRDLKREKELLKKRKEWAKKFHLSPFLVDKIFRLIIKEVLICHSRIFSGKKK